MPVEIFDPPIIMDLDNEVQHVIAGEIKKTMDARLNEHLQLHPIGYIALKEHQALSYSYDTQQGKTQHYTLGTEVTGHIADGTVYQKVVRSDTDRGFPIPFYGWRIDIAKNRAKRKILGVLERKEDGLQTP
jgi:hypothetical protein